MTAANPFVPVRLVGGIFALAILMLAVVRRRRGDISRLNLIITVAVSLAIGALAIRPRLFNPLFESFNFEPGNQRQLIAALLFAVFVLFALLVRAMASADANARNLRLLIESLAIQGFDRRGAESLPGGDRLVVVIPAHDEAENLRPVLDAVPSEVEGLATVPLVVDDASEDRTGEVAHERGALVATLPVRRGQGMALRVGYQLALRLGAVVVASLDADGQHAPAQLPRVVGPVLRREADMVVGSRVLGAYERESHLRHAGIFLLSGVVSTLYGRRITDVSSGFRALSAEALRKLVLEQDQYSSEIVVEALRHRARVKEVPITVSARAGGVSKKPATFRYGWRFTKAMLQTWLR